LVRQWNATSARLIITFTAQICSTSSAGAIPQHCLHMGRRCVGLVQHDDRVEVMFEDGSKVEADVAIGADGIHSAVRRELFGAEQPRFSGNVAYRGVVPVERVAHLGIERKSTNWMGPGGHFVHYFVSGGRYLELRRRH